MFELEKNIYGELSISVCSKVPLKTDVESPLVEQTLGPDQPPEERTLITKHPVKQKKGIDIAVRSTGQNTYSDRTSLGKKRTGDTMWSKCAQ